MDAIHYTVEALQQAHVHMTRWQPRALRGPRVIRLTNDMHSVAELLGALTADANFLEEALRRKGGSWDDVTVPLPVSHTTS